VVTNEKFINSDVYNEGMAWFKNTLMGLALFFSINYGIHAQSVTGKLSEFQTGKPLSGITVKVKNNTHPVPDITTTDNQGNYTIDKLTDVKEEQNITPITFYGTNNTIYTTGINNTNATAELITLLGQKMPLEYNNGNITLPHLTSTMYGIHIKNDEIDYTRWFMNVNGHISPKTRETLITKKIHTEINNNKTSRLNKTLNDILVEYVEFSGTTNTGEEIETTKYENVGTITNNGTLNIGTKTAKTVVTLEGTAEGIHPDSTHTYVLKNAIANVKIAQRNYTTLQMLNIGTTPIKTGTTDNTGKFSIHVPKIYEENTYYAIEIDAPNHHKKMMEVPDITTKSTPTMFNHIYSGKQNETKTQQVLHNNIDETYFYGVVLGGDLTIKIRGPPLAKWDADTDGYSRLKTWIQPNHALTNKAIQYCISDWASEGDAGILFTQVNDSTQADVIMKFLNKNDPKLEYSPGQYGNGTYDVEVDYQTNTTKKARIFISEGIIESQFENVRKFTLKVEFRQGVMNLHDIGADGYRDKFYGTQPTINTTVTDFEIKNIHNPYKFIKRGF